MYSKINDVKLFAITFFIIISTLFSLKAQKGILRGNVYDQETGEPIMYGSVSLEGTKYHTLTDLDGFFNITNIEEGKYVLQISYLGYKPLKENIEIKDARVVYKKILLIPEGIKLQAVDITAHKERRKSETQISKLQISQKQLESLPSIGGEPDIIQYLQLVPGIISTGDQGGQLYIRGGSPVQNKITLDGLTIINPFHSIGSFSVFETEAIQNVDVLTGGFNAEYGGRISAIVDIKTKDGNKKNFGGNIGINPFVGKILLEGPIVKFKENSGFNASLMLMGKQSLIDKSSELFYPYINSKDSVGLPYSFRDLYGKLSINLGGGSKINLFGFNFSDTYDNPKITKLGWDNIGGGMSFRIIPGSSNLIIDALFGLSNYNTELLGLDGRRRYSQLRDFTSKFNFSYFADQFKVDYGVEINTVHTDFTFENIFNQTIQEFQNTTNISAYVKFRKKWGGFIFEPGSRINYYASLGKLSLEPRLGFKLNISDDFRLKGSAGKYTQNLLSTTNDLDVVNYFVGFISSPEEKVYSYVENDYTKNKLQSAYHAILGIEYDILQNLELNIEGFYKYFDQLVVINRNKREITDPNYVVETGSAYGLDISAKYELKNLYFWLTYSLGFVNRNDGYQIYPTVYDRRHNINLFTNYNFGKDYSWQFGVRWNLGSGFPFTKTQAFYNQLYFNDGIDTDYTTENPDEFGIIYSSERNGGRLPYFHRLDLSLQKTIKFSKRSSMDINASIINVYNRANIFYFDRIRYSRVNQLPILPSLGLKFKF
ncbi:MAG TPA: TonB-dependent receptor [Bacteroidetes bacterium]|nr:TonB-dependent receptor [Bacteroidota bacterium]